MIGSLRCEGNMKGVSDAMSLNTDPPQAATLYSVQRSAEATTGSFKITVGVLTTCHTQYT